ncbi:MAG: hypothetical protein ACO1OG_10080 [Devosia sp.]
MNWLPRASMYDEMQANAEKRRANLRADLANSANYNAAFISSNTNSTEAVNLTLRVAAARVQTGIKPKV